METNITFVLCRNPCHTFFDTKWLTIGKRGENNDAVSDMPEMF